VGVALAEAVTAGDEMGCVAVAEQRARRFEVGCTGFQRPSKPIKNTRAPIGNETQRYQALPIEPQVTG